MSKLNEQIPDSEMSPDAKTTMLQRFKLDVDIMISNCGLKSDEIPCLVGENLPSSNSDENEVSLETSLKQHPRIQAVRGRLRFRGKEGVAQTLDEATMEKWKTDDVPPVPTHDQDTLLNDDDMEELKETSTVENPCSEDSKKGTLDLLTSDNCAQEDSSPCSQPVLHDQNPMTESQPPTAGDSELVPIDVKDAVDLLVSLTVKSQSEESAAQDTIEGHPTVQEHDESNCFNTRCPHEHDLSDLALGLLPTLDTAFTGGIGLDDAYDNLATTGEETPPEALEVPEQPVEEESSRDVCGEGQLKVVGGEGKPKKRVTFADEMKGVFMEPMMTALPEKEPDSHLSPLVEPLIFPLQHHIGEVYLNKGDEIDTSNNAELDISKNQSDLQKEIPFSDCVQLGTNEDLVLKNQLSPSKADLQKTTNEDNMIEKPAGKISKLYKSMKKKIGKIL